MAAGEKLDALANAPDTSNGPAKASPGYTLLDLQSDPQPSLKHEMKDKLPF